MAIGTALAIGLGVSAAVSAGASVTSGLFKKKAANDAAAIQQQAAQQAAEQAKQVVADTNPQVTAAADKAGQDAIAAGNAATERVDTATAGANSILNPYVEAGATGADVLNKGIAPGGQFNTTPTAADIQIDPGFAFRKEQATKNFERFAGANGGVDDGGAYRAYAKFTEDLGSEEYQAAFNRFQTNRQNNYNNVFGVANLGRTAATTQGDRLVSAGQYGGNVGIATTEYAGDKNTNATDLTTGRTIAGSNTAGDYMTQGANAQAAGKVAGSNALWDGVTGAVDAGTQAYYLSKYPNVFGANPNRRAVPRWGSPLNVNSGYGDAPGGTA